MGLAFRFINLISLNICSQEKQIIFAQLFEMNYSSFAFHAFSTLLSLILHNKCQNSSHYIIAFASPVTFSLWTMDRVYVLPQNSAEVPGGNAFHP